MCGDVAQFSKALKIKNLLVLCLYTYYSLKFGFNFLANFLCVSKKDKHRGLY